jgi:hypothetical protein
MERASRPEQVVMPDLAGTLEQRRGVPASLRQRARPRHRAISRTEPFRARDDLAGYRVIWRRRFACPTRAEFCVNPPRLRRDPHRLQPLASTACPRQCRECSGDRSAGRGDAEHRGLIGASAAISTAEGSPEALLDASPRRAGDPAARGRARRAGGRTGNVHLRGRQ